MTVNSTTNRVAYTGNGTANPLAVSFPFQLQADLKVVETTTATGVQTTKAITTDYTITGSTDSSGFYPNGGNVVPVAVVPVTVTWTIYRDPPITQQTQHTDNDPIPAASIDNPLDKAAMVSQRLKDRADRAVGFPDGDSASLTSVLPGAVSRASKVLSFDSSGNVTVSDPAVTTAVAAAATAVAAAASVGATVGLWTRPVLSVLAAPPGSPSVGDRYLVAHSGTSGAWIGHEDNAAEWASAGWLYSGNPKTNQFLEVAGTGYRWSQESQDSGILWRPAYIAGGGLRGVGEPSDQPAAINSISLDARATCLGTTSFGSVNPTLHFHKARGTQAAPLNIASGDSIGSIGYRHYCPNTSSFVASSAAVSVTATETPGAAANFVGCQYDIETSANGGAARRKCTRVDQDGSFQVFGTAGAIGATLSATGSNRGFFGPESTAGGFIQSDLNTALFLNRNGSVGTLVECRQSNVVVGSISVSGVATAYNTASDVRLKTFFGRVDTGAVFDSVSPHTFLWNATGEKDTGFFAQELYLATKDIAIHAVKVGSPMNMKPEDEGFEPWSVDNSKLVPLMWAEIQSLRARLTSLEARA